MKVSSHAFELLASKGGYTVKVAKALAVDGTVIVDGPGRGLTTEDLQRLSDSDKRHIITYLFNVG
jgi:hypothetical protein